MAYKKEDKIFSATMGRQSIYYFEDIGFLKDDNDLFLKKMGKKIEKLSELSDYIIEYANLFLKESDFESDGFVEISLGKKEFPVSSNQKTIFEDKNSSSSLRVKKTKHQNIDGSETIVFDYSLYLNIMKEQKEVKQDLYYLSIINEIDIISILNSLYGISDESEIKVLIASIMIDRVLSNNEQFKMLEYAILRKNCYFDKKAAFKTMKSVYSEVELLKK